MAVQHFPANQNALNKQSVFLRWIFCTGLGPVRPINGMSMEVPISVTSKKLPNVYKICPKMISLEKLKILVPLQKLPKNVEDMGKLIVAKALKSCHSPINRPIWSHWSQLNIVWTANSRHCFALWPLMSSIFSVWYLRWFYTSFSRQGKE